MEHELRRCEKQLVGGEQQQEELFEEDELRCASNNERRKLFDQFKLVEELQRVRGRIYPDQSKWQIYTRVYITFRRERTGLLVSSRADDKWKKKCPQYAQGGSMVLNCQARMCRGARISARHSGKELRVYGKVGSACCGRQTLPARYKVTVGPGGDVMYAASRHL